MEGSALERIAGADGGAMVLEFGALELVLLSLRGMVRGFRISGNGGVYMWVDCVCQTKHG